MNKYNICKSKENLIYGRFVMVSFDFYIISNLGDGFFVG